MLTKYSMPSVWLTSIPCPWSMGVWVCMMVLRACPTHAAPTLIMRWNKTGKWSSEQASTLVRGRRFISARLTWWSAIISEENNSRKWGFIVAVKGKQTVNIASLNILVHLTWIDNDENYSSRCSDSTEFGTGIGGIACTKCEDGVLTGNWNTDWSCGNCKNIRLVLNKEIEYSFSLAYLRKYDECIKIWESLDQEIELKSKDADLNQKSVEEFERVSIYSFKVCEAKFHHFSCCKSLAI